MRTPRIYQQGPLVSESRIELELNAANHLCRVLRLKPGAPLVVFNGEGGEFEAVLAKVTKRGAEVELGRRLDRDAESPLAITLVQCVSRGERMDYTVQKAVELGATNIVPVTSERTTVNLQGERGEKRRRHWRGVVVSACEQCGRNRIPALEPVRPLADWLRSPGEGLRLVLDPHGGERLCDLPATAAITLLIGPEGGLSKRELDASRSAGFRGLYLGPRVLRTETAAVAALAAIQSRWGDLG